MIIIYYFILESTGIKGCCGDGYIVYKYIKVNNQAINKVEYDGIGVALYRRIIRKVPADDDMPVRPTFVHYMFRDDVQ